MELGFMAERGTIDAVHLEKSTMLKEKSRICFVDQEKAIDRVQRMCSNWQ